MIVSIIMFTHRLEIIIPDSLLDVYKPAIERHNNSVLTDEYPNSGFDLFIPNDIDCKGGAVTFLNHGVKCRMKDNSGYYLYARSSISKTPLMMANSTGIIDSGYRGNIIGAVRNFSEDYVVEKNTRLFQICHASLKPFSVCIVSELDQTTRGEGGFGSTNNTSNMSLESAGTDSTVDRNRIPSYDQGMNV